MIEDTYTYKILSEEADQRIDVYLTKKLSIYSRNKIEGLIESGKARVNNKTIKPRYKIKSGDLIVIDIPKAEDYPKAINMPLDIIYEDNDILAINKPAGITTHPNADGEENSVVNALLFHYPEIISAVLDENNPISKKRPGIVHRLDKDTSGVLIIAKNKLALENLSRQFQDKTTEKYYLTILHGRISEERTIKTGILRKSGNKQNLMGISLNEEEGREAITKMTPIADIAQKTRNEAITLVKCQIFTGRTHQIRVHAKYIGHPVLGDNIYNNKRSEQYSKHLKIERQLLHSYKLLINHPTTGLRMTLTANIPDDFKKLLPDELMLDTI